MRSVLICQHDSLLVREIMPRWLASFTDLAGVLVIREPRGHRLSKVKRSLRQQGLWGTIDLLAYRLFHRLRHGVGDRQQEARIQQTHGAIYPPVPYQVPLLEVSSPNNSAAQAFIRSCQPEIMLACCKHILKPAIFEQASQGTYVMHPGICPEYRNAHGCFWALVNGDMARVGMTLLKIDRGIDTGPVYGYFSAPYDVRQSAPCPASSGADRSRNHRADFHRRTLFRRLGATDAVELLEVETCRKAAETTRLVPADSRHSGGATGPSYSRRSTTIASSDHAVSPQPLASPPRPPGPPTSNLCPRRARANGLRMSPFSPKKDADSLNKNATPIGRPASGPAIGFWHAALADPAG
jgi:Formyl transferase